MNRTPFGPTAANPDLGCGGGGSSSSFRFGGWDVVTFEESRHITEQSVDAVFTNTQNGTMNLAVLDAAVEPGVPDDQQALNAIATVSESITGYGMQRGLNEAANIIHDPTQPFRHRNGLIAFAGTEICEDGTITAFRCADAEVWAFVDRRWMNVFPLDMLTREGRRKYADGCRNRGTKTPWQVQEKLLDDLTLWNHPTLGLDRIAHAAVATVERATKLLISSDGAELTRDRVANLADWMDELHRRTPTNGHLYPHGDLSLILATRTP